MASYPTSIKSFITRNTGDVIQASHANDLQDEVNAIETGLINGLEHNLIPESTPDNRDIGSSTKKWRDFWATRTIEIAQGAITADTKFLNFSSTWNAGAVTFIGALIDITDTASAAASKFVEYRIGGAHRASFEKSGALRLGATPASAGIIRIPNAQNIAARNAADAADIIIAAVNASDQVVLGSSAHIVPGGTADTFVLLTATQTLTNKTIGTATITGAQSYSPDNSIDIGTSALRVRSVYVGTGIRIGTSPASDGTIRLANASTIKVRNAADVSDITAVDVNTTNQLILGAGSASIRLRAASAPASGFDVGVTNLDMQSNARLASFLDIIGIAAPAVSAVDAGRIYYDSTADKVKISLNAGAFNDLITGMDLRFFVQGNAQVANKLAQALIGAALTFTTIRLYADTAPAGADLIVRINKNGVSQGTFSITAGSNSASSSISIAVVAGDRISLDITQVGSTTPGGNDLMVTLHN